MIFKRILTALWCIERGQRKILDSLERLEAARGQSGGEGSGDGPDKWLQEGIDNILAYQAGSRKEERR